jgi:quercetin dioxygenase-like cupin family protein
MTHPNDLHIFETFPHDIDHQRPFGLRIRVTEETPSAEAGTICLLPHTEGAPLHMHCAQDEEFTVISGELFVQVGERKITLTAGQQVKFPRLTPHTYANRSDHVCIFTYRLTPGGDFTHMMRELETLSRRGKITRLGELKTMLHLAAVISRFGHHVRSVKPPHCIMRLMGFFSRFA